MFYGQSSAGSHPSPFAATTAPYGAQPRDPREHSLRAKCIKPRSLTLSGTSVGRDLERDAAKSVACGPHEQRQNSLFNASSAGLELDRQIEQVGLLRLN